MKYLLVLLIIINFLNAEIKKTYYPNGKMVKEKGYPKNIMRMAILWWKSFISMDKLKVLPKTIMKTAKL